MPTLGLMGLQSQVTGEAYRSMVRATWPPVLKAIYPGGLDASLLREWRQHQPNGLLILRHYFPDEHLSLEKFGPTIEVGKTIQDLRPVLEVPINEAWQTSAEDIARLSTYSEAFVSYALGHGFKAAVGIFSEGNPSNLDWWSFFHPALRAARNAGGYLALHEYWTPGCYLDGWHSLRYRKVWEVLPQDCRVPILITETGIDGGINAPDGNRPQTGWRGYCSATDYRHQLDGYHTKMAEDPYVHGATVFLTGGFEMWRTFDTGDELDLRPAFSATLTMPERWVPHEEVPTMPDVVLSVTERHSHAVEGNWGAGERFGPCVGVLVHSTGGGTSSLDNEYLATINWFQNPNAGVSTHRIVGGGGRFAEVNTSVHDNEVCYGGREPDNSRRRHIELTHGYGGGWDTIAYPEFQYQAAGELIARWQIADAKRGWVWPIRLLTRQELAGNPLAAGVALHKDTKAGVADGKRDPSPPFDPQRLMAAAQAWYDKLAGGGTPVPPANVDQLRDKTYALAGELQKLGAEWRTVGYPHHASYCENTGEAIKDTVAISKQER